MWQIILLWLRASRPFKPTSAQAYIGAGPRCVLMARNGMRYDPLRLPFLQAA
jgi:hypothetical protein